MPRLPWPAPGADRPAGPRSPARASPHGRSAPDRRPIPCARPARACAASFRRRRVRLRITALPIFFVTVKPSRAGPWSSRGSACNTTPGIGALRPLAAARRNSARRVRRPGGAKLDPGSGRQALAALGPSVGQDPAPADGGHAGTESVPPLADQLRRLIGALHGRFSDGAWTPTGCGHERPTRRPSQAAAYRGAVMGRQSRTPLISTGARVCRRDRAAGRRRLTRPGPRGARGSPAALKTMPRAQPRPARTAVSARRTRRTFSRGLKTASRPALPRRLWQSRLRGRGRKRIGRTWPRQMPRRADRTGRQ